MQDPLVTIVVVPRERLSFAARCINSIYENTNTSFNLVYISGGVPTPCREYLEMESARRGFRLILEENYLSPNHARNLALPLLRTQYTVFLDNDTLVTKGWLEKMLACAEETQAAVVGPLYLVGEFERAIIHMAGGRLQRENKAGKPVLVDEQYLFDTPISKVTTRLQRRLCDYVEFHCMLVRTDLFKRDGLIDEKLSCLHEERDFCLTVASAGGKIYMEPKAVVTYVPPPPCEWWDLPYFMLRWSEAWIHSSVRHFNQKWGIASVRHISDSSDNFVEGTIIGFGRAWRRRVAGTTVKFDHGSGQSVEPLDQAKTMIALLQSVDRESFDFARIATSGEITPTALAQASVGLHQRLPSLFADADDHRASVGIRPANSDLPDAPTLIALDRLRPENMSRVRERAFMTLEVEPDLYQCWLALDTNSLLSNARFAGMLAQLSRHSFTDRFFGLAGTLAAGPSLHSGASPDWRIRLIEGTVGRLNTATQVEPVMDLFRSQFPL